MHTPAPTMVDYHTKPVTRSEKFRYGCSAATNFKQQNFLETFSNLYAEIRQEENSQRDLFPYSSVLI
jgi:hypothetical protein